MTLKSTRLYSPVESRTRTASVPELLTIISPEEKQREEELVSEFRRFEQPIPTNNATEKINIRIYLAFRSTIAKSEVMSQIETRKPDECRVNYERNLKGIVKASGLRASHHAILHFNLAELSGRATNAVF